ncbi:hypothetical protein BC941DRAFT_498255 [Chlamydoabsidia padenii]|nr:hypothetical protein BC941DRAFT_498255 [Chlamydoabsidia padenii]
MADKGTTDNARQAKLLAARKKLKKFQNKKMEPDLSPDHDGVLFTDHGTPLAKTSDNSTVELESPFFIPPSSSPPPQQQQQPLSLPHAAVVLPMTSPIQEDTATRRLEQHIQTLEQEKAALATLLDQHRQTQASSDQAATTTITKLEQKIDQLQASNDDFHTEITRMIDMVSDLEESLASTQAADYTKACEIKSLQIAIHDLATTNTTKGLMDTLDLVTQERDGLRDKLQRMEIQARQDQIQLNSFKQKQQQPQQDTNRIEAIQKDHEEEIKALKQQLAAALSSSETKEQGLGVLMDSVQRLENGRVKLEHQLTKKDQTIQRLEHSLHIKDKGLDTASLALAQLEQQYTAIKQTLNEKEALVTDLLEIKNSSSSSYLEQADRMERLEQKMAHKVLLQHEQQQQSSNSNKEAALVELQQAWRVERAKVVHLTKELTRLTNGDPTDWIHVSNGQSPSLGLLPPLVKPAFSEFLETPRCSGCQSDAIDI